MYDQDLQKKVKKFVGKQTPNSFSRAGFVPDMSVRPSTKARI